MKTIILDSRGIIFDLSVDLLEQQLQSSLTQLERLQFIVRLEGLEHKASDHDVENDENKQANARDQERDELIARLATTVLLRSTLLLLDHVIFLFHQLQLLQALLVAETRLVPHLTRSICMNRVFRINI